MQKVQWRIRKAGNGWEGEILLPSKLAPVKVATQGKDKKQAIARAAGLAAQIATNPLLAAAMPPGTGAAVMAISKLATDGRVKAIGAGAKRLAKALGKFW